MKPFAFLIGSFCLLFFEYCVPGSGSASVDKRAEADSLFATVRADIAAGDFEAARAKTKLLEHKHRYTSVGDLLPALTAEIDSAQAIRRTSLASKAEQLKKKMRKEVDDMRGITFYYDPASAKFDNRNDFGCYLGQGKEGIWLRFRAQYYGNDWLFVQKLMVKADTSVFELFPTAEIRKGNGAGDIWEVWDEQTNASNMEVLKAVAESKDAKVRFVGREYHDERKITPAQKQAIRNVFELYEAMTGAKPM